MFRMIRVRLVLSYAGIALLVTLALGVVLLLRLRSYYTRMELDYLQSNAKAISGLAAPLLTQKYPKDIQEAQVSNLAFLSQTRVQLLDPQRKVLADSGPRQGTKIGLGVVKAKVSIRDNGGSQGIGATNSSATHVTPQSSDSSPANPPGAASSSDAASPSGAASSSGASAPSANPPQASSVIVIQRLNGGDGTVSDGGAAAGIGATFSARTENPDSGNITVFPQPGPDALLEKGQPNLLYINSNVPVSSSVYGMYLSKPGVLSIASSDQRVLSPIIDSSGARLGYVELSEGPAYGREIVNSVASGLAVAGGLAILLAIVAGWWTSRRLTAPLLNLTDATLQMSSGDLSVRVSEADRADEFGILGKSFNQMASRIEETVHTLRRFLADAAHELQTPLTALRTNLELARSEQNSADTNEYLNHALEQIDRLQRMIKDLLNLSHLESGNGNGQAAVQQVDLADLIRQVSEPFAACAEQAGQAFDLDLTADAPVVMGSPEKLRSALGNLLDNAIKFTPSGGKITVKLSSVEENLHLTVSDTGIGIPPDDVEMLFNRFHRGRNASSFPGSGLGLAIVQAIAKAHGGTVQAMNNPGSGARFTLILPRARTRLTEN